MERQANGSLLTAEEIEILESLSGDESGDYSTMLSMLEQWIEVGVANKRFTLEEAKKDLTVALWYSYAGNNLDDYLYYYKVADWMQHSEENAAGCATWYYRYSVALTYCGRLEEARDYAEKGALEEPTYPWVWLQVGKLRSHFGDKKSALEAAARGLELVPGDYEFLTLKDEIEKGYSLEEMEYHSKQPAISCIRINEEGLERFWNIFGAKPEGYTANSPTTHFPYKVGDVTIEWAFHMNEAGMSKLDSKWLEQLKEQVDTGKWLKNSHPDGRAGVLETVIVRLDYNIGLLYKLVDEEEYFQVCLDPNFEEMEDGILTQNGFDGPVVYTVEELHSIEDHIKKSFGEFDNVLHEIYSPDIHLDVCIVPPTAERDFYTFVTMGMGAYEMDVPEALDEYKLKRAELAISLPADWKVDEESMKDEKWYWPIRLLKSLARLPIDMDTWLAFGHTIENEVPFAKTTALCASLLVDAQGMTEESSVCVLPNGDEVNFYHVIPIYQEELAYKMEHNADMLLEKMGSFSFVVDPARPSA